ncbi:MAG TPA: hypothetical protein VFM63_01410 [Pyrinomonadaceae bacterium]|nr:hypothetical protein [Pyrinomonadaceae bacterium]
MKQIALVLFIGFALSLCNLSERLHKSGSSSNSSGGGVSENVEPAKPTAAQTAALNGGKEAKWERQGMSFTVPPGWTEAQQESKTFSWRSPGEGAASLIVSISPMSDEFPVDSANQATFESAKTRAKNGEVDELKWIEIDGLKGVLFREANPEQGDDHRRLQFMTYRKYTGQVQGVNVMLASYGKDFERHKDAMYGILYSMKITH